MAAIDTTVTYTIYAILNKIEQKADLVIEDPDWANYWSTDTRFNSVIQGDYNTATQILSNNQQAWLATRTEFNRAAIKTVYDNTTSFTVKSIDLSSEVENTTTLYTVYDAFDKVHVDATGTVAIREVIQQIQQKLIEHHKFDTPYTSHYIVPQFSTVDETKAFIDLMDAKLGLTTSTQGNI